jgi:hypothetical protein
MYRIDYTVDATGAYQLDLASSVMIVETASSLQLFQEGN